jgi:hypothetical protein
MKLNAPSLSMSLGIVPSSKEHDISRNLMLLMAKKVFGAMLENFVLFGITLDGVGGIFLIHTYWTVGRESVA